MKFRILVYLTILPVGLLRAQVPSLEPTELITFPNIQPDSLAHYTAIAGRYADILALHLCADQMTPEQQAIMSNDYIDEGPYYTGPIGCSWYCATWPDTITSSSSLQPQGEHTYYPENAHDFDLRTAWVVDNADPNQSKTLTFQFNFSADLQLTTITVFNGYAKDLSTWKANSRVKTMELMLNGAPYSRLDLQDTFLGQVFEIGSHSSDAEEKLVLSLRILEIYPGDRYTDIAISEVNFDGTGDH